MYRELIKDLYDRRTSYEDEPGTRHPRVAQELISRLDLTHSKSVLDVGTGTGLAARLLAETLGPDGTVVAIDTNHSMLAQALRKADAAALCNIHFIVEDATRCSFASRTFDVICCCEAMVLFENPAVILQRWFDWLKPGGTVAFTCTHSDSYLATVWRRAIEAALNQPAPDTMHDLLGNEKNIHSHLQAAGFSNITIHSEPSGSFKQPNKISCNHDAMTLIFRGAAAIESLTGDQVSLVCSKFNDELSASKKAGGVWVGTGLFYVYAIKL